MFFWMANCLTFMYMLTVLEQTLLEYQTQHRPDFHYSEALISQFLSERHGCLLANRTWDESAQSPNIILLVYSLIHTIKFPFRWWYKPFVWSILMSAVMYMFIVDIINYTKLSIFDMYKICLNMLYLTWLKQLLCRWASLVHVYICQCPEWFDQLDVIYTIVLLKLCFLRLSSDRNHTVSLEDFLNIQTRHL